MAFRIGTPFSPEILALVQRQQQMQRSGGGLKARKVRKRDSRPNDLFLRQQFAAEQAEKDRNLRRELAQGSRESEQAKLDRIEAQRRGDLAAESSARESELVESRRRFEAQQGLAERKLENKEELANLQRDRDLFRQVLEFGGLISLDEEGNPVVDETVQGSRGARRRSQIEVDELRGERLQLDTERLRRQIEGSLPDQVDDRRRTDLIEEGLRLREAGLQVRQDRDAEELAMRVWNFFRDPTFGGFGNEDNFQRARETAAEILQIIRAEGGDQAAQAFQETYQQEGQRILQQRNAEARQEVAAEQRRANAEARRQNTDAPGDEDLDAFLRQAIPGAGNPPPDNTGR